jgi:type IV secretory pathway VirB9-like protein
MGRTGLHAVALIAAVLAVPGSITTAAQTGVREVAASERGVIPLQTRLRYTTMVVLPDGEEILDVLCGDRDFWGVGSENSGA